MTQRFYPHNLTASGGTLPGSAVTASAQTPAVTPALGFNRTMDGTPGSSQSSIFRNTLANTSSQLTPMIRAISDPLAAQTIPSGLAIVAHCGASESNASSDFKMLLTVTIWRPSTGARVGDLYSTFGPVSPTEPGLSETAITDIGPTFSDTAVVCQLNDVLILELWRTSGVQGMATAYVNTIFFDGTTEDSITSNAAYVDMGANILLASGSTSPEAPHPPISQYSSWH